jgi:5-methylthioadenosine/S-adenosylhomocysteine deaminase
LFHLFDKILIGDLSQESLMMKYLFYNAFILSMDSALSCYDKGIVQIDGSEIIYVGNGACAPPKFNPDRIVDCQGDILMPGFVNAHAHTAMTLFRGYGSGKNLQDWLYNYIFPIEEKLLPEDVYFGSMIGIAEMLLSGTTCFNDMYNFEPETAKALAESGMRGRLCSIHTLDEAYAARLVRDWDGAAEGRIRICMGLHSIYTKTGPELRRGGEIANRLGVGVHIHVSETTKEVEDCLAQNGCTPFAYLAQLGVLDNPVVAAHCVDLRPGDLELMKRYSVAVAHCPSSNLKLGSGISPVAKMRDSGITVGLGTDGVASNNNVDMLEEASLASLLSKGFLKRPEVMDAMETLAMATRDSATAIGLGDCIGTLAPGKRADMIRVSRQGLYYMPYIAQPEHQLLYSGNRNDIRMTMVDGNILAEDGELKTIDLDYILSGYKKCIERLYAGGGVNG